MKRFLVSGLLVLLFASMLLTIPSGATVVWSDNFDDGNLDGWTISGVSEWFGKASILAVGNVSAADKTLRATGVPHVPAYSLSSHPTMITTGTWSFDLYFNPGGSLTTTGTINFLDKPIFELPFDWNGHEITISDKGSVYFKQFVDGTVIDLNPVMSFKAHEGTWTHIDVTRDYDGRWRLYANGTLAMDIVDKKFSDFSYFGVILQPGPAVDNVVVSDTIYVPPGSLKVTVKDSGGNTLFGTTVSSTKQPSGQTALSGTTTADGTITFTGLAPGNYTLQVSKSGYVSGSAQGVVASGAKTELSSTLQAQPSSGDIPGFPFSSVVIGVLLCTIWYWLYARRHSSKILGVR